MTPEFSRLVRIDTIGEGDRMIEIAADAAECAALADRFVLRAVTALSARFHVRREAGGIAATGRVVASVVQACSVTDEPIAVAIDEPVALRFAEDADGNDTDVELSEDTLDTLPIEQGAIDLGEAAAETMALTLDPFPRGPNAAAALKAAGVVTEDEVARGPFADLKAKLGG